MPIDDNPFQVDPRSAVLAGYTEITIELDLQQTMFRYEAHALPAAQRTS
jgi:hypothetical protein